ncbi:hypothetical protein M9458_007860, partial [Cirrhinus mrigala]
MSLRPCASGCGSFLASLDGHDRCLTCLGREHAEAAFTDGTKSLSRQGFSAAATRHLGDIQVTVQNVPSAPKAPRTSACQSSIPPRTAGWEIEMSAAASEGESDDEADDSAGRYPPAVAAPSETDAEL